MLCQNKARMVRLMRTTLVQLFSTQAEPCLEHTKYLVSMSQVMEPFLERSFAEGLGSLPDRDEFVSFFLTVLALLEPQNKAVAHTAECAIMYTELLRKCRVLVRNAILLVESLVRSKDGANKAKGARKFEMESGLCFLMHAIKSKMVAPGDINMTIFTQLIKMYHSVDFHIASAVFRCACLYIENGYLRDSNEGEYGEREVNEINSVRETTLYALDGLFCENEEARNEAAEFIRVAAERSSPGTLCYIRSQPKHYFCAVRVLKMVAGGVEAELSHASYIGTLAKLIRPEWLLRVCESGSERKSVAAMAAEALRSQLSRCLVASPLSRALRAAIDGLESLAPSSKSVGTQKQYFSERISVEETLKLDVKTLGTGRGQIKYFTI